MIVVDTNVIASAFLERPDSTDCREALGKDREWVVPPLWRSEFLSVLRYGMHLSDTALPLAIALPAMNAAELLFGPCERPPDAGLVLSLCSRRLKSYDAEFLALAEELDVQVLSNDVEFLAAAGARGITPRALLAG